MGPAMTDLTAPKSAQLASLAASAASYAGATITPSCRKQYAVAFARFQKWCESMGLPYLPTTPEVCVLYFTALADGLIRVDYKDRYGIARSHQRPTKVSYIRRQYTAIIHVHRAAGIDWPIAHPAITKVLTGIARRHGEQTKRMAPLEIGDLKKCLEVHKHWPPEIVIRDRALLSLGFFAALRRSELVALHFGDIEFVPKGLRLTIRKSKEDQTGKGEEVAIPSQEDPTVDPVRLVKAWLDHLREEAYITAGPVFRRIDIHGCVGARQLTAQSVALIVKGVVEKAGLDPERFAGHSLRAGFATSAAAAGKDLHNIMRQTRHKSERVAMTYIRHGSLFRKNAAAGLSTAEIEPNDDGEAK
jgi:integrase